jgi:hypothetical protein
MNNLNNSWMVVLGYAVLTLAFIRVWGWIDGTDAWYEKQRAEWKKDLPKNGRK